LNYNLDVGKANRPFVIRIKPGQSYDQAVQISLDKPRNKGKKPTKILVKHVK